MKVFLIVVATITLIFGFVFFEAWIGMLLFNWVMSLFGVAFTITFWQAFGLCALLSFVGGFFKSSTSSSNPKKSKW